MRNGASLIFQFISCLDIFFCVENGESRHPRLDIPGPDYIQSNHKVVQFRDYDTSDTAIAY